MDTSTSAIFQPTYLKEWYRDGFNTTERDATLFEKHPGKFVLNTRWDPREGDDGLRQLTDNVQRWGCTGAKLYTAEWRDGSRGWTLKDPEAFRFLERCQELGVKNIHLHKGPTIWPLDKDGFDVEDVDVAATMFPDLNFIVEHVGLPRIEDFCFIAVQEPNVYAGLSVVIGGLMHARPKLFAKVMGELVRYPCRWCRPRRDRDCSGHRDVADGDQPLSWNCASNVVPALVVFQSPPCAVPT